MNRDHEAEFHYLYADQAKDSNAVYILKMKAGRNLVTNKIKIEVKVERTKFSADCEEPLHARPKHTYVLTKEFSQNPLASLENADPSDQLAIYKTEITNKVIKRGIVFQRDEEAEQRQGPIAYANSDGRSASGLF